MMTPAAFRYDRPTILSHGRPSATSLMVESNSLRATKSIKGDALRLPAGSTATLAPTSPALSDGLADFSALMVAMSEAKDGADVCSTARSKSCAREVICASLMRCGGASISVLPSTRAAGWASHVGYQNDRISRRAWYRD